MRAMLLGQAAVAVAALIGTVMIHGDVRRAYHVLQMRTPSAVSAPAPGGELQVPAYGPVNTYRPAGPVRGAALFLSGAEGWSPAMDSAAKALTEQGLAVAGISTPDFEKALENGTEQCANPNGMLSALSKDFEHQLGFGRYVKPILVGSGSGAGLAYGAFAETPAGMYRGGISFGFTRIVDGTKPWCKAPGLAMMRTHGSIPGWRFAPPSAALPAPWLILEPAKQGGDAASFFARVPQARAIAGAGPEQWLTRLAPSLQPLLETSAILPRPSATARVDDLPLTIVYDPSAPASDTMAAMYSGDGGWAGLDRDIAAQLAAKGVPVVGVDSLDYFWTAHTPVQAGNDLGRIINHFSQQWQRPKVMLVGYSFGADDLPFIVASMPPALRPAITRVSLLGLSPSADFQFHLASWLDMDGDNALPTIPAIEKLEGMSLQCIRGAGETDSACPAVPAGMAAEAILPGGHHFDGNAPLIAATLLSGVEV
ncbi:MULTISPECIES: virulence factor family protein [unclassified Novosphingobium]|uniref:virulence factor family protein n=1 Tax=unclassified Novosphingobium TaxID=2644732 RepID=UPI001F1A3FB0|nr:MULTISPECIES: AcvB/VirJ family lysyl-phosphatidylglycerol hydrolase [unclassified Novosphingobium]